MTKYEYVEDGLGDIYGVGVVYAGRVVDDADFAKDQDGKPVPDLSEDKRFKASDSDATSHADLLVELTRVPEGETAPGVDLAKPDEAKPVAEFDHTGEPAPTTGGEPVTPGQGDPAQNDPTVVVPTTPEQNVAVPTTPEQNVAVPPGEVPVAQ